MSAKNLTTKNKIVAAAAAAVVVIVALLGYVYWPHSQPKPEPVRVQAPPPPPPPPPPVVQQVVEVPPPVHPLPQLGESDSFVLNALAELVGNKSLMKIFHTDRLIRKIVATVDNLPGKEAPMRMVPVKRPRGSFLVSGGEDDLTISPKNASRYRPYVKLAEVIDTKGLVGLYVRLYPLFQQAYEELGYPKKYFNDRLIVALDDLLAAPNIKEPVKLVQPKVFYLYADPDLEARSIGQRIMMRVGSRNEARLKTRLRALKQELLLHMHDKKVESAASAVMASSSVMAASSVK